MNRFDDFVTMLASNLIALNLPIGMPEALGTKVSERGFIATAIGHPIFLYD